VNNSQIEERLARQFNADEERAALHRNEVQRLQSCINAEAERASGLRVQLANAVAENESLQQKLQQMEHRHAQTDNELRRLKSELAATITLHSLMQEDADKRQHTEISNINSFQIFNVSE